MSDLKISSHFVGMAICALLLVSCAQPYSKVNRKSAIAVAVTAEQRAIVESAKPYTKQPLARMGRYLDSANAARLKLKSNPSDSIALSNYNFAVSRVIEIIEDEDLAPWERSIICESAEGAPWNLNFASLDSRPEFSPSNFEILPTDRYDFKGKLVGERIFKQGLGAPLVGASEGLDFRKFDQFAMGERIFYGLTAAIHFSGKECNVVLKDPLSVESLQLDGHTYPLAADFQAPLSLALAETNPKKSEFSKLFKPDRHLNTARLARLQPYDPVKIPVLFIHGLGDSQATWAPMIDSLRNDLTIRRHYQFWVYSYPTGQPYPLPAEELRRQLDQINRRYPDHKEIVVVGHSMGGMISRALITDSGSILWNTVFDMPPGEMGFNQQVRKDLSDLLIFKARPDISRVIYASASHRGSELAAGFLGRLGARAVGSPIPEGQLTGELLAASRSSDKRKRLPNSIEVLDPGSPFLAAVDTLPPKPDVPYHSIIGDRGKGGNLNRTKPESTDGIVRYWSSHLDGARSELIIPSDHWTIHHPEGIAEVNRILRLHLEGS